MCTVSYLPGPGQDFILTSNRDEAPERHATELVSERRASGTLYYPKDPGAGGTWFCLSDSGTAVCLLNGAFKPFRQKAGYRKSRGSVVLSYFDFPDFNTFSSSYDLTGIAPFTLVTICKGQVRELLWDGIAKHIRKLNANQPHFWSSVTLYPRPVRMLRKQHFHAWLQENTMYDQQEMITFHKYGGPEDTQNGFVMNRDNRVKTLSITSVRKFQTALAFEYHDLTRGNILQKTIKLQSIRDRV